MMKRKTAVAEKGFAIMERDARGGGARGRAGGRAGGRGMGGRGAGWVGEGRVPGHGRKPVRVAG
jgi:hypothetical protein